MLSGPEVLAPIFPQFFPKKGLPSRVILSWKQFLNFENSVWHHVNTYFYGSHQVRLGVCTFCMRFLIDVLIALQWKRSITSNHRGKGVNVVGLVKRF